MPEALLAISSASSSRSCSAWRRARSDEASSCGRLDAIHHFPRGDIGLPCCPLDRPETREYPGPRVRGPVGAGAEAGRESVWAWAGSRALLEGRGGMAIQPCGRAGGSWQTRPGQGTAPGRPVLCRTASWQLFYTFLWKEDLLQETAGVHFLPHMGKDGEDSQDSRAAVLMVWSKGAVKS